MTAEICRFLEWDSDFFGLRIARAAGDSLRVDGVRRIREYCAREHIDCVYFLAAPDDPQTRSAAEDGGFHLVDIRVTLDRAPAAVTVSSHSVRTATPSDLPALREIARVSHHDSRFYSDPRFPRDVCGKLYETWLERSCAGWAQKVWVVEADGAPGGYLTCHVEGRKGTIGLIAVREACRGLGLGAQLMNAALDYLSRAGVDRLEVVTQGCNIPSQRLYQRFGFRTSAVQLWYHYWTA